MFHLLSVFLIHIFWRALAFSVSGFDLSSVKACTSGGAPLGSSVISEVYKRLGILVRMGYGLSETSGVTGQVARSWKELEPLLGSTGSVFGGTEVKIISLDNGKSEFGLVEHFFPVRELIVSRSSAYGRSGRRSAHPVSNTVPHKFIPSAD
jgi:acyl-CoA synthetase (AMP-forming)/AMP-acid ligase II